MGCLSPNLTPTYPYNGAKPRPSPGPPGALFSIHLALSTSKSSRGLFGLSLSICKRELTTPVVQKGMRNKKGQWARQRGALYSRLPRPAQGPEAPRAEQTLPRRPAACRHSCFGARAPAEPISLQPPPSPLLITTSIRLTKFHTITRSSAGSYVFSPSPTTSEKAKSFPERKRMKPTFF